MNDDDVSPAAPDVNRPRREGWRGRLRAWLPWAAAGYLLAAFTVTHVPMSAAVGGQLIHADKLVHASIFAGLSLLIAAWRAAEGDSTRRAALTAFVVCLIYGTTDELTQLLTASRKADVMDLLADAVGALLGLAAFFPLLRWWRRHG